MVRYGRRRVLRAAGAAVGTGLAGCSGRDDTTPTTGGSPTTTPHPETTEGTPTPEPKSLTDPKDCGGSGVGENGVRLINLVPDADAISVDANGSELVADVPYTGACGRTNLGSSPQLTVSAGGSTVFDDTVSIPGDGPRTLAIAGEFADDGKPITPIAFEEFDGDFLPGNGSMFQVVHGSPDAPGVELSAGGFLNQEIEGGITFGQTALPGERDFIQASGSVTIRDAERGDPIATFSASFASATLYTLFVIGYQTPGDEPGDSSLGVLVTSRSLN